jgi:hypothetical protein
MIIGDSFVGDNDGDLKLYQHYCYYDTIRRWIDMADVQRMKYRTLPEWEGITQLWEKFRESGVFDHRSIQLHHDLIAARFRQEICCDPFRTTSQTRRICWREFFDKEATTWLEDDRCIRLFMTALVCGNTEEGYQAEDALAVIMQEKYHLE